MPHCRKVASLSLYTIAITPDRHPAALLNSLYIIIYLHQTTIYTNTQQQTPSSYSNQNCCKINNLRTLNFSVDINQQLTLAIKKLKSAILTPENGDWRMEERLTRERDRETDCISLTIKKSQYITAVVYGCGQFKDIFIMPLWTQVTPSFTCYIGSSRPRNVQ